MKIYAFTQGIKNPSSRFRIRALMDLLECSGYKITVAEALSSAYPPESGTIQRLIWLTRELLYRLPQVLKSHQYDAVILQREMISTLPTFEILTKRPRIFDVDDAIWLHRNGIATNFILRRVDHIICGNQYIADYCLKFKKPMTIIPTGVDTDRFKQLNSQVSAEVNQKKIIGWSGTSSGFKFIYEIESELNKVLLENPNWILRIVSNQKPVFKILSIDKYEYIEWSEENEVQTIAEMDIGIMPLTNTPWSCGKCSYKMLLYMACSVPVVVSDFGMNSEVLSHKFVGFGVSEKKDWVTHLNKLISDSQLRSEAGKNGREVVKEFYSLDVVVDKWVLVLNQFNKEEK
jgi:glycosyltransferase involved in cell wall biosynthesis